MDASLLVSHRESGGEFIQHPAVRLSSKSQADHTRTHTAKMQIYNYRIIKALRKNYHNFNSLLKVNDMLVAAMP